MDGAATPEDIICDGRHSGLVERYHTWRMTQKQNIGAHSWQMWRIYNEIWGLPSAEASGLIMCHDAGELSTGDPPLYAKRDVPDLKPLMDHAEGMGQYRVGMVPPECTETTKWRVKACDILEGFEHALVDWCMGNQYAVLVQHNYARALHAHLDKIDDESERVVVRDWANGALARAEAVRNAVPVEI